MISYCLKQCDGSVHVNITGRSTERNNYVKCGSSLSAWEHSLKRFFEGQFLVLFLCNICFNGRMFHYCWRKSSCDDPLKPLKDNGYDLNDTFFSYKIEAHFYILFTSFFLPEKNLLDNDRNYVLQKNYTGTNGASCSSSTVCVHIQSQL